MRDYLVEESLKKTLKKLNKKDKTTYKYLIRKIDEIININDIEHYKNLKSPMQDSKRVHIKSSFVLIFSYDKKNDFVYFEDFDHHDNIYR